MSGATIYVVWGGYPEQAEGEPFADFPTMTDAERYVKKTLRANPRLLLHIRKEESR